MKPLPMLALLGFVCLMLQLVIVRSVWAIFTNEGRAWNILVAFDRIGNAAANDDDKVTISSRAAYARDAGKPWGVSYAGCWIALTPFIAMLQKISKW